jgi:O-antigen ligase/tetratricopeptide (TPR) repeat protein
VTTHRPGAAGPFADDPARRPAAWTDIPAVGIGLAVFAFLGWDQPLWDERLQLVLHVLAAAAIGLAGWRLIRGGPAPRTPVRIPLLALLVAIGVASVFGENPGLAALAFASSLAYAAMLPVGLAAVERRPTLTALAVSVPTLVVAAITLGQMVQRRSSWFAAGAPGLIPPIRVVGETTPFGSVAVPAFVVLLLVPVTYLVGPRRLRIALQVVLAILGVPLTVLSGSRSAWIALAVATAIVVLSIGWRRRPHLHWRWSIRWLAVAALAAAALAVSLLVIWPRLTSITSLVYRERLWADTLAAWRASPWIGIGPGTMPYARQAAGGMFPLHQPHSHDMALGVLGDAGVLGLLAAVALVVVFFRVAGPHRARSMRGRTAAAVLVGIAVGGFFDDITFLPGFALLVVLAAAIALVDAGVVRWERLPEGAWLGPRPEPVSSVGRAGVTGLAVGLGLATVAIGVVTALGDAGGVAYHAGSDAAWRHDWAAATASYRLSETLDPWNPATPKSLAITSDAAGHDAEAIAAAERATNLNPGDGQSWTNLALLCLRAGDRSCAARAVERAAATGSGGAQILNVAIAYDALGDQRLADLEYVLATRQSRDVSLLYRWPRPIPGADLSSSSRGSPDAQLNVALARIAAGLPVEATGFSDPAVQALILAVNGSRSDAESRLAEAERTRKDELLTWDIAAALERHWGVDATHAIGVANALRGGAPSVPELPRLTWDVAAFRSYPLDGLLLDAQHLVATQPWPWSLEQVFR